MPLSQIVSRYFDAWINTSTWHTRHPLDDERFYQFVHTVKRYANKPFSDGDLRRLIVDRWSGPFHKETLEELASDYASLYASILEYEKAPFPDPIVEKTSIYQYYNALLSHFGQANMTEIDADMSRTWGENWRQQLDH